MTNVNDSLLVSSGVGGFFRTALVDDSLARWGIGSSSRKEIVAGVVDVAADADDFELESLAFSTHGGAERPSACMLEAEVTAGCESDCCTAQYILVHILLTLSEHWLMLI